MIKVTTMLKRKEGLTPEEFNEYWYGKHTPLARKVTPEQVAPNRHIHNYAVRLGESWDPAFDGIGSLCFADAKRFLGWNEWFMTEEAEILHEDELNFVEPGAKVGVVAEEKVIVAERKGAGAGRAIEKFPHGVKLMAMLKRKEGMTAEQFSRYWHEEHGPMAVRVIPESVRIRRYVQNHALRLIEDAEPCFDGIVEFCLEDMDALHAWMAFYASDEGKIIRDDEIRFIDIGEMVVVMVEERVIS
jgi:uncharacterized protein (TIGR02118 family)